VGWRRQRAPEAATGGVLGDDYKCSHGANQGKVLPRGRVSMEVMNDINMMVEELVW